MLSAYKEDVLIAVPSGGQTDAFTRERLGGGGAATLTTVSVVWVANPKKDLVIDQQSGVVQGVVKSSDVAALYQPTGIPSDVDWNAYLKPEVAVLRKGLKYNVVAVSDSPFRTGWQVIYLRLQEGANAGT